MRRGELTRLLHRRSVFWERNLKAHELWRDEKTGRTVLLPRHRGEIPDGTLHAILGQLRITLRELLDS